MTLGDLRIKGSLDENDRKVRLESKQWRVCYLKSQSHLILVEAVGFWCGRGQAVVNEGRGLLSRVEGWIRPTLQPFVLKLSPGFCFQFMEQTKPKPATPPHLGFILSLLKKKQLSEPPLVTVSAPQTHSLGLRGEWSQSWEMGLKIHQLYLMTWKFLQFPNIGDQQDWFVTF